MKYFPLPYTFIIRHSLFDILFLLHAGSQPIMDNHLFFRGAPGSPGYHEGPDLSDFQQP
jgi:hypothetical protein